MSARHFFRWRPVSVILIILAILYGVFTPLNIWLANITPQRGEQQLSHVLYWGAFWNAIVAILCFSGRQLIRRRTRACLALGAGVVATALFIVMRTWLGGLLQGQNPLPLTEVVLIWLPMLYAIVYALRESKREDAV